MSLHLMHAAMIQDNLITRLSEVASLYESGAISPEVFAIRTMVMLKNHHTEMKTFLKEIDDKEKP